jgi:D-alanine--poly(phosphoribitol) ligase subunit 2
MNDVSSEIRQYLATKILFEGDPAALRDDTELVGSLVDSLGLMQLVSFIEEQYGVTFEDDEVSVENFRTLGDMDRLVLAKMTSGTAPAPGAPVSQPVG